MSPVAPRRQRTARTYALAAGGVAVALVLAIALFAFAVPAITKHNTTSIKLGAAAVDLGLAKDRAAQIADGGPILLPDQSGGDRDVYLQHLGTDANRGWLVFDARKPGQDRSCTLGWDERRRRFTDSCGGAAVDERGTGLVQYRVNVSKDGHLVVDLNPNHESGTKNPSGGTTTTTLIPFTGTLPNR